MRALVIPATLVAAALAGAPSLAGAQPRPQPQPGNPPPRPRAVQAMTLTSSAWIDGGEIPARHAQAGRDVSPPLAWSGAPEGVASYVLVVRDVDAPASPATDDTLHWLVWNIPGTAELLPEGLPPGDAAAVVPASAPAAGPRQISATGPGYRGPAAPAFGPPHHYLFELFALDAPIDLPAVGQSPAATRVAVMAAMAGHVRGKGVLVGRYRRPAP